MIIRKYLNEDRDIVRKICADTAKGNFAKKQKLREAVKIAYVDYYLECEPQNVFVVEENGVVGGYVVCSLDAKLFQQEFPKYIKRIKKYSLLLAIFQKFCLKTNKKLDVKYGGGFHINLDKNFQGGGVGTALLSVMGYHLKKNNINYMYLITANKKTRGYGFYKHYGFRHIKSFFFGSAILLTYDLSKLETEHSLDDIQKKFILHLD